MKVIPVKEGLMIRDKFSSVSPKGQITIPVDIRAKLGLKPKDKVSFQVEVGAVKIFPTKPPLEESYQAIPPLKRKLSLEQIEKIISEEAAKSALE